MERGVSLPVTPIITKLDSHANTHGGGGGAPVGSSRPVGTFFRLFFVAEDVCDNRFRVLLNNFRGGVMCRFLVFPDVGAHSLPRA